MCAGPTKFGRRGANAVGEEYLRKCVCAECMKMCCLGGKNSVVKGLICAWRINESH